MEELFYRIEMSPKEEKVVSRAVEDLMDYCKENEELSALTSNIFHYLSHESLEMVLTQNEMLTLMLALDNLVQKAYDDKNRRLGLSAVSVYNTFSEVFHDEKARQNIQDNKRGFRNSCQASGCGL